MVEAGGIELLCKERSKSVPCGGVKSYYGIAVKGWRGIVHLVKRGYFFRERETLNRGRQAPHFEGGSLMRKLTIKRLVKS
jgi:hypothetical protein